MFEDTNLEESRDCLAFATEPVYASLANVLGRHDNLPAPVPPHIRDYKMFELNPRAWPLSGAMICQSLKSSLTYFSVLENNPSCIIYLVILGEQS